MSNPVRIVAGAAALALAVFASACGGGATSPSGSGSVTLISKDSGTGGASGATVTLTGNGVSASNVTIAVGQTVTFVNNDTRTHQIDSNPHPQHGSCPSIENGVDTIAPGQQKVTHNFGNAGVCSYHDHLDDTNPRFQGTITIQ